MVMDRLMDRNEVVPAKNDRDQGPTDKLKNSVAASLLTTLFILFTILASGINECCRYTRPCVD